MADDWPLWAQLLLGIGIAVPLIMLDRAYNKFVTTGWRRCKCGKTRNWYFLDPHQKSRFMVFDGLLLTGLTALSASDVLTKNGVFDWIWTVLLSLWTFHAWRKLYYHEKDKLRSVVRQLGRVVVTEHGTLKVAHAKD